MSSLQLAYTTFMANFWYRLGTVEDTNVEYYHVDGVRSFLIRTSLAQIIMYATSFPVPNEIDTHC